MQDLVFSMTRRELETLVIDCVKVCLTTSAPPPRHEDAPSEDGRLISKKSAAHLLSCSNGTIDNFRRSGRLRPFYVGRSVKFDRAEVLGLAGKRTKQFQP